MFGYVMINKGDLKVRELETYQAFYCGLCQKLKERYGLSGQLYIALHQPNAAPLERARFYQVLEETEDGRTFLRLGALLQRA